MTAAAEKRKSNPARQVETLAAQLERRREKLAAVEAEIVELEAGQAQVVAESLKADPAKSAFLRGSPASERERKLTDLKKTAEHLRAEVSALQVHHAAAAAALARHELAERTKEAKRLARRERELRQEAAETFAALVERWNALADLFGERMALAATVRDEKLRERVGFATTDLREWEEASGFLVEPVPTTLAAFLDEALEATSGPRFDDDDEGLAELNRYRATHSLPAEVGYVSPSARELAAVYSDLRGRVRSAEVEGVLIRRLEGPEVEWPSTAA